MLLNNADKEIVMYMTIITGTSVESQLPHTFSIKGYTLFFFFFFFFCRSKQAKLLKVVDIIYLTKTDRPLDVKLRCDVLMKLHKDQYPFCTHLYESLNLQAHVVLRLQTSTKKW